MHTQADQLTSCSQVTGDAGVHRIYVTKHRAEIRNIAVISQ